MCYFVLREVEVVFGGYYDFWFNFYFGWFGFFVNDYVELFISFRFFDDFVDFGVMFIWWGYFDICFVDFGDEVVEIMGVLIDGILMSKYFWINGEIVWNDSN